MNIRKRFIQRPPAPGAGGKSGILPLSRARRVGGARRIGEGRRTFVTKAVFFGCGCGALAVFFALSAFTLQDADNYAHRDFSTVAESRQSAVHPVAKSDSNECGKDDITIVPPPTNTYTVCNGLSNQLLGHAANIAHFLELGRKVAIPDAFIVNGIQSEINKDGRTLKNVMPTKDNSIPLTSVIEAGALLNMIHSLGGEACFIPHDMAVMNDIEHNQNKEMKCSWLEQLWLSDNHDITLRLLQSMKPSYPLQEIVDSVISNVERKSSNITLSDGVCLHHRDGPDWQTHCSIWEGNNCMNFENESLENLIKYRLPNTSQKKWMYYVGDANPSQMLVESVFEKANLLLLHREKDELANNDKIGKLVGDEMPSVEKYRDVYAAVDFFVCRRLPSFIGNSVSTFSATQIALRRGTNSSWYNSRSVPLFNVLHVATVPIVYTYTEQSQSMGKVLLKTSITSVRCTFGLDIDINVIYHGTEDKMFLKWLADRHVVVHNHEPQWLGMIEDMLAYADHESSHLYAHIGNYIGTWQRIDIPSFIDAEYIMFLDSDTVVHTKFDLAAFGADITPGIAFSSELDENYEVPCNAGVSIMNVPKLRETYADFLAFIKLHVQKQEDFVLGPSDQGAYLDFYGLKSETSQPELGVSKYLKYLDLTFNVKPYYEDEETIRNRKIIHFHGMKPHDILKAFMGYNVNEFPPALRYVFHMLNDGNHHLSCLMLRDFAISVVQEDDIMNQFCSLGFPSVAKEEIACKAFLQKLSVAEEVFGCEELMSDSYVARIRRVLYRLLRRTMLSSWPK